MPQAKIALTIPRLGLYGGAEGFGWRLAEALAAQGHAVDFSVRPGPSEQGEQRQIHGQGGKHGESLVSGVHVFLK